MCVYECALINHPQTKNRDYSQTVLNETNDEIFLLPFHRFNTKEDLCTIVAHTRIQKFRPNEASGQRGVLQNNLIRRMVGAEGDGNL